MVAKSTKIFNAFEFVKPNAPTPSGLYWPNQLNYLWEYCHYLGSIVDSNGRKLDLGVCGSCACSLPGEVSDATAYGNEPENYRSGPLKIILGGSERWQRERDTKDPYYKELFFRAVSYGLAY